MMIQLVDIATFFLTEIISKSQKDICNQEEKYCRLIIYFIYKIKKYVSFKYKRMNMIQNINYNYILFNSLLEITYSS